MLLRLHDISSLQDMSSFLFIGTTGPKMAQRIQVVSRDEHGSELDLIVLGLKPILVGSGLDRTAIFFKIGGSGPDRTEKVFVVLCDYSKISKILVVIRFHMFAKW